MTKPLRSTELFEAIAHVLPFSRKGATQMMNRIDSAAITRPEESVFDEERALSFVARDRELLVELIGMFFVQIDELLPLIRSAVERGDSNELARSAHKLNGSVGSFGLSRAHKAAQRVEIMGRRGDFTNRQEALADLDHEVGLLGEALMKYLEKNGACLPVGSATCDGSV